MITQLTNHSVWIKVGICSADSIINIALCCLGYLPGLIHAWYIILKHPEPDDEYAEGYQPIASGRAHGHGRDPEGGRVTYYYVAHQSSPQQQAHPHAQRTYGTAPPFGQQQHQWQQESGGRSSTQEQPQQSGSKQGRERGQQEVGEGSHARPPPTYAEAVKGDHKIQDREQE